jgi:glycolate oxidase FAD binding subunit
MAYANHDRCPVLLYGAGSKLDWGGLVGERQKTTDRSLNSLPPLIAVSTDRLNHLIDHAVGDLTVTVEAGMRFAELQSILAKAGQFLAIDPAFPEQATIGGIVATADTGSLRHRYNSVRDMLLGLSFVRADGQVAKAGGRVVKNVAGYDLMKLFTGSYGTLGIITQVTFRVYPLPEASQTVVLTGGAELIAQASAALLSSALTPVSVDLLSAQLAQLLNLTTSKEFALAIRFQGIQPSVQQQVNRVVELGQSLGLTSLPNAEVDKTLWEQVRKQMTLENQETSIACKIGVRPSEAITVLQQIDQIIPSATWYGQIHMGSGLGRLVFSASDLSLEQLLKVRSLCQSNSGFLSILKAPTALKQQIDVWGYPGNALDLMQKIKQQFDPNLCLNPHRFVGGI